MEATKSKPRKVRLGAVDTEAGDDKVIGLQPHKVADGGPTEVVYPNAAEVAPVASPAKDAPPVTPWAPSTSPLVIYWMNDDRARLTPYPAVICNECPDKPGCFDLVRFVCSPTAARPVRYAAESPVPANGCFTRV
jgi:hypothetical protein